MGGGANTESAPRCDMDDNVNTVGEDEDHDNSSQSTEDDDLLMSHP